MNARPPTPPARTRAYALIDRLERQDDKYCVAAAAIALALLAVAEAVAR